MDFLACSPSGSNVSAVARILVEHPNRVDAGDDDRRREAQRVPQAVDGRHRAALQDHAGAHRLHPEDADVLPHQDGEDARLEAVVLRVHRVEGHLHGVEAEPVPPRLGEHREVDVRALVPREADEARLARLAGADQGLDRPARGEHASRVRGADDLVDLEEVHVVGAEAPERVIELPGRFLRRAPVELRHDEGAVAEAARERLAEALLAVAVVVVPAVVEEGEAVVHRLVHDTHGDRAARDPEVIPPETEHRDRRAGAPEGALGHLPRGHGVLVGSRAAADGTLRRLVRRARSGVRAGRGTSTDRRERERGARGFEELPAGFVGGHRGTSVR